MLARDAEHSGLCACCEEATFCLGCAGSPHLIPSLPAAVQAAQALAATLNGFLSVLNGFYLAKNLMPAWWRWFWWVHAVASVATMRACRHAVCPFVGDLPPLAAPSSLPQVH